MKHRRLTSSISNIREEGEKGSTNQLSGKVKLGDLIWVKLHGSSWWPSQVVDANTVSESIKPRNRSVGEVLVRLYGSYEYSFVDPMESRSEFEHVLKENNCSYREIFHKSLERDRPHFNSSGSKGKGSKPNEFKAEAITARKLEQNILEDNQAIITSESRIGMLEGHPGIGGRLTRAQKGSFVAESLEGDVSDDEGITMRSVKYLVNVGTSAKVSPRRLRADNASPTIDKDGVTNKVNCFSHKFEEEMKSKTALKVQKKLMPNNPSAKEARNGRSPEKDDLPKKLKPSPVTPTSAAPSSGHSQELSSRRVKMMQSLGLVAPSGSPF